MTASVVTPLGAGRWAPTRAAQLVLSCAVLGSGVALLLRATLGADGYSTLVSGMTRASGLPFVVVNALLGIAVLAMAWARGIRPGVGSVVQPVAVGLVVTRVFAVVDEPRALAARIGLLLLALALLSLGVAGYLGTNTGAGPAEAAGLAWDPPVPFRWSYTAVQVGGAGIGFALGADIGPGTVLVALTLGPLVDLLVRRLPALRWEPLRGQPPRVRPARR